MTDNYLQLRPKGLQASLTESCFWGSPPHARPKKGALYAR
jgi:hypothetical protein